MNSFGVENQRILLLTENELHIITIWIFFNLYLFLEAENSIEL